MERKFALLSYLEKAVLRAAGLPIWESKIEKGIGFADPEFKGWVREANERVCRPLVGENESIDEAVSLANFNEILRAFKGLSGITISERLRESL